MTHRLVRTCSTFVPTQRLTSSALLLAAFLLGLPQFAHAQGSEVEAQVSPATKTFHTVEVARAGAGFRMQQAPQQISFTSAGLSGANVTNPTSLQFGPDGRLYVSEQFGTIKAFTVQRSGKNSYAATDVETINLVKGIPNYEDDDGSSCTGGNCTNKRQVTGILLAGTASNPVLYVSSSDPRIGAGSGSRGDVNLDTNSGIVSKLTCTGGISNEQCGNWEMVHLVRGLPRSEENHASNGMALSPDGDALYLAQGGHTNAGAPSNNFAKSVEYALSAALLEIDLTAVEGMSTKTDGAGQKYKYDLPTLDDPTRANNADGSDPGDPFGGNNGLNQAKLVENGPVQIYSPGYRNAYDLVVTEGGKLYIVDNGANGDWGGYPQYEESYACTNDYLAGEPGSEGNGPNPATYPQGVTLLPGSDGQPDSKVNNEDNLHYVPSRGFYGGHPTPIRANPEGAGHYYNGTYYAPGDSRLPVDWPPVPASMANPVECDFQMPGDDDGALYTWGHSTNGLTEYTASNFGGALKGNLLAAGYNGAIHRLELNGAGDDVVDESDFASGFGSKPLDVVAQGDTDPFGGTVWAVTYGANNITIFEPGDYDGSDTGSCSADDDPALDEDNDGYSNADEIDNDTNPCSAASKPDDFDGDLVSDLNDSDDDGDGLLDTEDPFALDADNGTATSLPVEYELFNNDPGFGFGGVGFTGLMTNGSDYLDLLDPDDDLIIGGTSGLFTDPSVGEGDVYQNDNTQANALQFGIDVDAGTAPFTIEAQLNGPFNGLIGDYASQGIYIGTGDQDNYLKVVLNDGSGNGGIQVFKEVNAKKASDNTSNIGGILNASNVTLYLSIDPAAATAQPRYAVDGGAVTDLGSPVSIPASWLSGSDDQGLAVGFIATSTGPASEFGATWDYINVTKDPVTATGDWELIADFDETRHENAFVQAGDKFYLLGGRESQTVKVYDPDTETWSNGATLPSGPGWPNKLHHFQAVEHDGLIYAGMAFGDNAPNEVGAEHLYLYDPVADVWMIGAEIPENRRRGSAGAFVRDGKIYFVAGIQDGHSSGHVKWFDAYDPATNTWTQLDDAPRARDHFFAVYAEAQDKLYLVGGRTSGTDGVFLGTIPEVDVYDFGSGSWSTLPSAKNIPTERAAAATGLIGGEIVVAGGEKEAGSAKAVTEAFNVNTQAWRTLAPMLTPRHGTQAIVSNNGLYVAAGSPNRGGPGNSKLDLEAFYLFGETSPTGSALSASALNVPSSLGLGTAAVGSKATKTLTLTNTGSDQGILVQSVAFSGSGEFFLGSPFDGPVVLAPGASLDLDVTFQPDDLGVETGTLTVSYGGGSTADVTLSGEGGDQPTALVRVNAGGAQYTDGDGNVWEADAANTYFSGGKTFSNNTAISGTEDDALYQTERYGGEGNATFSYNIPVSGSDGPYTVDLLFAEIFQGVQNNNGGAGDRVFDVEIEGNLVLNDYDIFADVGPATAVVKTFAGLGDANGNGTLDIVFDASVDNAKVSAIAVYGAGGGTGTNQPPQVDPIADQTNAEGDDISNAGLAVGASDPDNGPQNLTYSISGQPAGVDIEPTNGQVTGAIADGAAAGSPYDVTVTVSDGASQASTQFTWTVTGPPVAGVVCENLGGSQAVTLGGKTFTAFNANRLSGDWQAWPTNGPKTAEAIAGTDGDLLYQTEIGGSKDTDGGYTSAFAYNLPVSDGNYTVELHFAEIYWGASANPKGTGGAGQRVFDVSIEGATPPQLDDYDINADVGPSTAVVKTFPGVSVNDGNLTIDFSASVNRPKVSGVCVTPVQTGDNQPPVAQNPGDQTSAEGETVTLPIEASDPNSDPLTFSAANLPAGLSIDESTGEISGTIAAGNGGSGAYQEQNGLVVIETESGSYPNGWRLMPNNEDANHPAFSGATGGQYLQYDGGNKLNNPGNDVIEYQVEIAKAGTYQFQWRSRIGFGSNSTEHNDSWLKINADDFYAQKGNSVVYPKGSGKQPTPEGAGGGGWFKVYLSGSTSWTWSTKTFDNNAHDIFATFNSPGVYTVQVSGRSDGHAIDRMVLHHIEDFNGSATDTGLPESPKNGGTAGAADGSPYSVTVSVSDGVNEPVTVDFQWTVTPPVAAGNPSAFVTVNKGGGLFASTYGNNSFMVQNTGDVPIESVTFDLSTALLPDVVFDPDGKAGDSGSKCFSPGAGTSSVGLVSPSDPCAASTDSPAGPFDQPHNSVDGDEGYNALTAQFNDFGQNETFGFSVDIDPTSIKGDQSTGDAGSISGFELIGSTVTIVFENGTVLTAALWDEGSAGGSQAVIAPEPPATPSIAVQGAENPPATVSEADQTVVVTGTPGASVTLLRADARLYIDDDVDPDGDGEPGYDTDPFEANEVLAKQLYTATIGQDGTASIPVTLTKTPNPNPTKDSNAPDAGLNHFVAVVDGEGDQTSLTSEVIVLEYDPNAAGEMTIAGAVRYSDGAPMAGAELVLSPLAGGDAATATAGSSGAYALEAAAGQSYALAARAADLAPGQLSQHVTAGDALRTLRHAVNLAPFEAPSMAALAADADGDGEATAADALWALQAAVGLRSTFEQASDAPAAGYSHWRCVAAGSYAATYAYDPLAADQAGQDFACALRGDADLSWQGGEAAAKAGPALAGGSGTPLRLALEAAPGGGPGGEAVVEVRAEGFRSVGAAQFTVEWDAEAFAFAGLDLDGAGPEGLSSAHFNAERAESEGALAFGWFHPAGVGQTLPEGARLFAVRLRPRSAESSSAVEVTGSVASAAAYRVGAGGALAASAVEAAAAEVAAVPAEFALRGNYPNPFNPATTVAFDLPEAAKVTLEVFDVAGRRVLRVEAGELQAGSGQRLRVDGSHLASGLYLYRVVARSASGTHAATGRMTLLK